MSKNDKLDVLFASVKKMPMDISLEDVSQMVSSFPTLPPPKPRFPFNNLNQLIMGFLGTTILAALLLWPQFDQREALTETELPTTIQEGTVSPILPDNTETDEALLPDTSERAVRTNSITRGVKKEIVELPLENEIEEVKDTVGPVLNKPLVKPGEKKSTGVTQENSDRLVEGILVQESEEVSSGVISEEYPDYCESPLQFRGKIKFFKRGVIRLLKADKLISSIRPRVLLSFHENELLVNRRRIPDHLQPTYLGFLEAHNVTPCPIRIIEITPLYIAVGDITADGFHGKISGKANINDLEYSLKNPITPLDDEQKPHNSLQSETSRDKEPEGRFPDFCDDTPQFNGGLKPLKRKLVGALMSDKLIKSVSPRILVSFYENKVVVNRRLIPEAYQEKYLTLLSSQEIFPCAIRVVEIKPQYIALGDITVDGFEGIWDGKATKSELEASMGDPMVPLNVNEYE